MKTFLKIVGVIIVFALIVNAFSSKDNSSSAQPSPSQSSVDPTPTASEYKPNWSYSEETDKMDSKVRYFASIVSTNEVEFEFPYNGGSILNLYVRKMDGQNEVILNVNKGQFIHSLAGNNNIKVKFDDDKPLKFSYNSPADHSTDQVFINSSNKFISRLKTAKKMMIEIDFYQASGTIFEFEPEGLVWKH